MESGEGVGEGAARKGERWIEFLRFEEGLERITAQ